MTITERWKSHIPCQFSESQNILSIIEILGKQLTEVEKVFTDLIYKTDIDGAEGYQLDMLGTVVNISRQEAYQLIDIIAAEVLDDVAYRNVLRFKALKNNSDATYADIMKGLYLLWGDYGADISYKENDIEPAQISIDIADIPSDTMDPTMIRPMVIKPGGVKIYYSASFKDKIEATDWERFTNLVITYEKNHFYNGDYIYDGSIQYHPDGNYYFEYNGRYKYNGEIWYGPYELPEVDEVDAIMLNQAKIKMLGFRMTGSDGWKITHFAFGTGLESGERYIPDGTETALKNEVCRTEVITRTAISDTIVEYIGAIGTNQCAGEYITEIGLVDSDGDLVCIKTFDRKLKKAGQELVFKIDDIITLA